MDILEQLNAEQREAVTTIEGALLVLAGAGSGKTRVVTFRIIHLLQMGVPALQILGLTFTNKAAQEMRERVHKITDSNVLISTFHGLGARLLRESISVLGYHRDFNIYDDEDVNKVLRSCFEEVGLKEGKTELKEARRFISHAKNHLVDADDVDSHFSTQKNVVYSKIYRSYQAKMKEYNAVDFDDLLFLPVKILKEHPEIRAFYQRRWSFLLIDEYQDTNEAQYILVKYLVEKTGNLCVVGDPDQSIYSWRGANIQNIMNFEKDYPGAKITKLEENYRSRSNILEAANALISHNSLRYEKNLWSGRGEGEKIKVFVGANEREEVAFITDRLRERHERHQIPWNQMAIFYRTHAQSRGFEDLLYLKHIPYAIIGGISFYQRREIKDILAFLKMVHSGSDFLAFERTINLPKCGIGGATLEKMRLAAFEENHSIFSYCEAIVDELPIRSGLRLDSRKKQGLHRYVQAIRDLRKEYKNVSLAQLVKLTIEKTDYELYLKADKETFDERMQNLNALIAKAAEWELSVSEPSLISFLEELSLKSNLDESDSSKDRVHLMTIHNGKGLEYDTVFVVGLEEGLFPHASGSSSNTELEEERRLCYVGMTRAKEVLHLSYARQRYLWGISRPQAPSRFLAEIPFKYVEQMRKTNNGFIGVQKKIGRQLDEIKEESFSDEHESASAFKPKHEFSSEAGDSLQQGDFIFHKEFGIGIIQGMHNSLSVGLTYRIVFTKDNRERSIVAKYSHLKKI